MPVIYGPDLDNTRNSKVFRILIQKSSAVLNDEDPNVRFNTEEAPVEAQNID